MIAKCPVPQIRCIIVHLNPFGEFRPRQRGKVMSLRAQRSNLKGLSNRLWRLLRRFAPRNDICAGCPRQHFEAYLRDTTLSAQLHKSGVEFMALVGPPPCRSLPQGRQGPRIVVRGRLCPPLICQKPKYRVRHRIYETADYVFGDPAITTRCLEAVCLPARRRLGLLRATGCPPPDEIEE
jgi:hypothetical protein